MTAELINRINQQRPANAKHESRAVQTEEI